MDARTLFVGLGFSLLLAACSSNSGGCPGGSDGRGRADFVASDTDAEFDASGDAGGYVSRGFRYNPAVCDPGGAA